MNLDKLMVDGLAKLRKSQNPANKPSRVRLNYNHKNNVLYFSTKIKSKTSNNLYTVKLKLHGIEYSKLANSQFRYRLNHPHLGLIYLPSIPGSTRVTVKCTCPDDYFMWQYSNRRVKSLIGKYKPYVRVPGSTRPPVNPMLIPGSCKHTLRLIEWLSTQNIIKPSPRADKFIHSSFNKGYIT